MPVLRLMAVAVVTGGITLGALLGTAANPKMKEPPEQPWQGALQPRASANPGYLVVEAAPQDLSPYPDSYAPTWAREELADWEPDYPEWTYSDYEDEAYAEPSFAEEPPQPDDHPPVVTVEAPPPPAAAPLPAGPAPYARVTTNLAALY